MSDLAKYAKLMKLDPDADLPAIKQSYAEWQARFETQMRSDNPATEQKGRNNLLLLDQAYQAMAAAATQKSRKAKAEQDATAPPLAMSVELGSHRIGLSLYKEAGFRMVSSQNRGHFKISWPAGNITLFSDKLKLKALVFAAEIDYRDIDSISRYFFMPMIFRIKHHAPDVYPLVILNGFGLGAKIKRLNDEHQLGLPIEY